MDILLTNDDGIEAAGLWAAAEALAGIGKLLVVAPAENCSGHGTALPPAKRLRYSLHDTPRGRLPRTAAIRVAGTPATCVQVGLSGALARPAPGLVVSGISDTRNVGRDIFFSGTVGAAFTAHLMGVPALAVSLDSGGSGVQHWQAAGWALGEVMRTWCADADRTPMLFNVNVPNLPVGHLSGFMLTSLSSRSCVSRYWIAAEQDGSLEVGDRRDPAAEDEPGTDAWALARGYVSVTPLRLSADLVTSARWSEAAGAIRAGPPVVSAHQTMGGPP